MERGDGRYDPFRVALGGPRRIDGFIRRWAGGAHVALALGFWPGLVLSARDLVELCLFGGPGQKSFRHQGRTASGKSSTQHGTGIVQLLTLIWGAMCRSTQRRV